MIPIHSWSITPLFNSTWLHLLSTYLQISFLSSNTFTHLYCNEQCCNLFYIFYITEMNNFCINVFHLLIKFPQCSLINILPPFPNMLKKKKKSQELIATKLGFLCLAVTDTWAATPGEKRYRKERCVMGKGRKSIDNYSNISPCILAIFHMDFSKISINSELTFLPKSSIWLLIW